MLKVYYRATNEEVAVAVDDIMRLENKTRTQAEATHYQRTYVLLCNPCYGKWMDLSDHINDMPRWYVPGLDRALGSDELERRMKAEFVRRFDVEDSVIINMVNRHNPTYRVVKVA